VNAALVLSAVLSIIGVFTLSEATKGVGFLALAVLFAIFARIQQSHEQFESKRLDLPPSLVPKPSRAALAILGLAFVVTVLIVVIFPIFNEGSELQRMHDAVQGSK
jgi:O-antigen ligase